jgi:nucleotide-binding universal stress UspA family protein
MYSHILATLDGSALSEAILPQIEKLAAGTPLRVTLLAVAEDPSPISSAPRVYPERLIDATGSLQEVTLQEIDVHREGETHGQAIQRVEAELMQYLERQAARLREKGIETACAVAMGDPVRAIIERARAESVDAIAMASHGRTGLSQLLSGSIAAQVIERSHLPIIVVAPDGVGQ